MINQESSKTASVSKWLEVILQERFGHTFQLTSHENTTKISLAESDQFIDISQLSVFSQEKFNLPFTNWKTCIQEGWKSILKEETIPAPGVQVLHCPLIESSENGYHIHYDILGLTYWMLSRQEEVGRADLDNHGRFPATASHAYKHGYLERPIVDEWLHILGQVIQRTWPQLKLKKHQFSMKVSHDVDNPSRYGFCIPKQLIRAIGGDIIKRLDFKSALLAPWIRLNNKHKLHPQDPYNTFDWIMDVSEQNGLTSAFYFICGGTTPQDADYQPEHPAIRALMRRVHERGHEIGLHPSYNTYQNPQAIVAEAQRLKKICAEEGIQQEQWGGRMHYLRWEQPTTLYGWEQAGMNYDSSLGYADRPGFRCGTCFEYHAFDPVRQEILNVRIRPLIAMECSIMSSKYMSLNHEEKILNYLLSLKKKSQKLQGSFSLLWHNSFFLQKDLKKIFQRVVK
ncbi:MAG: hypothetical protein D3906_00020 [Candidatus Electrothrix sp. AUS1_2]|nr:hypothetical protein [Candidatus Electrothrix sp. AUS1_2]